MLCMPGISKATSYIIELCDAIGDTDYGLEFRVREYEKEEYECVEARLIVRIDYTPWYWHGVVDLRTYNWAHETEQALALLNVDLVPPSSVLRFEERCGARTSRSTCSRA